MSRRLAQLALSLYPLAFRRRYGEELSALLEDAPPRMLAVLDLLRGAILAHLRPTAAGGALVDPSDRLRASASGQLACWVAFAAAGFGSAGHCGVPKHASAAWASGQIPNDLQPAICSLW